MVRQYYIYIHYQYLFAQNNKGNLVSAVSLYQLSDQLIWNRFAKNWTKHTEGKWLTHSRNTAYSRMNTRQGSTMVVMMTSSNGDIFRVTGPLRGEFTGHRGKWRGALMFSLVCAWINGWENNPEAGDLRRHRAHYGITVMIPIRNGRQIEHQKIAHQTSGCDRERQVYHHNNIY